MNVFNGTGEKICCLALRKFCRMRSTSRIFPVILQSKSFAPLRIKGLVDSVSLKLAVTQLNQAKRVAFLCKYNQHFIIQ